MTTSTTAPHDRDELAPAPRTPSPRRSFFEVHNLVAMFFLLSMRGLLALRAPDVPVARDVEVTLLILLGTCGLSCLPDFVSSEAMARRAAAWTGHVYRFLYVYVMLRSYLMLRDLLPALRPDSLDAELLAIDRALFGGTPALWLDRFNHQPVIEWFSAFYFSYFLICAFCVGFIMWGVRDLKLLRTYAIGGAIVFYIGQLIYVAVPGYGPLKYLADSFDAPLAGGFFWGLVEATVAQGGAMKDIFPSLHTALPTYFTLFAFFAAKTDPRFRIISRVLAFMTVNIIISTMLLRWHYAIDVVAGLALAFGALSFARWAAPREARLQASLGLTTHWDPPVRWDNADGEVRLARRA
ncbi:MAG: phosphatase PAP2 family protein [Myxococcota bacterium]